MVCALPSFFIRKAPAAVDKQVMSLTEINKPSVQLYAHSRTGFFRGGSVQSGVFPPGSLYTNYHTYIATSKF